MWLLCNLMLFISVKCFSSLSKIIFPLFWFIYQQKYQIRQTENKIRVHWLNIRKQCFLFIWRNHLHILLLSLICSLCIIHVSKSFYKNKESLSISIWIQNTLRGSCYNTYQHQILWPRRSTAGSFGLTGTLETKQK